MFKIFECLIIGFFLSLTSAICCNSELNNSQAAPVYLYKILTIENWDNSQGKHGVILSAEDKEFIHLATEDQYQRIADKYFATVPEYVLLKIDAKDLEGKLVLEANPGGSTKFYHLYEGSIPVSAVKEHFLIKK